MLALTDPAKKIWCNSGLAGSSTMLEVMKEALRQHDEEVAEQ